MSRGNGQPEPRLAAELPAARALRQAFDQEWGRVVATLMSLTRDWDLAEESAQEAFARAAERWPADGVPSRPGAWLTTVARRHAIDRLRRSRTEQGHLLQAAAAGGEGEHVSPPEAGEAAIEDDLLALAFSCCHPALPVAGRVALTLRSVLGVPVEAIARALGVSETTMSQRITRAKQKVRHAGVSLRLPAAHELSARTADVLAVTPTCSTARGTPPRPGRCWCVGTCAPRPCTWRACSSG